MPTKGSTKNTNRSRRWILAEVARLEILYPSTHNTQLAKLFSRSVNAIKKKARKMGLEKDFAGGYRSPRPTPENVWTEREVKELKHRYPTTAVEEIADSLGRTMSAVQTKATMLRLKKAGRWSAKDEEFLRKHYPDNSAAYLAKKLDRTVESIRQKAVKSGLTHSSGKKRLWTKNEDRTLKKIYFDWPIDKVAKRLGRTVSSVKSRALKLGFIKQPRWTDEETEQLMSLYPMHTRKEAAEIMGLSIESIYSKIKHLGLRKNKSRKKKVL